MFKNNLLKKIAEKNTWKKLLKKSLFVFDFWRFSAKLFHFTQTTASPIYKTTFPKWQQQRAATSPLLGRVPRRQLRQGGDGREKVDLGEDWLVFMNVCRR